MMEVGRAADELGPIDVKTDPLQRRAMPGLQVDLAVALTVVRGHVVIRDQVPRARKRLVVLVRSPEHDGGPGRGTYRRIGDDPDVLPVVAAVAQLSGDPQRVVRALLALPAHEDHGVAD